MRFSQQFIVVVCVAVAVLTVLSFRTKDRPVFGWNDASRWDTVWSLMNNNGFVIDEAPYQTGDRVYKDGHFYSSKPALLPIIVACITYMVSLATGLMLPGDGPLLIPIVLLVLNLGPFLLLLYLYGNWLGRTEQSNFTKCFCLLTAANGTYLTAYNITLNNHTVAATGVLFALVAFLRAMEERPRSGLWFLLCGAASAWAVVNELHAALFGVLIFFYLYASDPVKAFKFFLPPALLIIFAFFMATYAASDGFVPFYLKPELYHYPGSPWNNGGDAAHDAPLVYLFNHLLGHHGIFSLSPVFLFACAGTFSQNAPKPIRTCGLVLTFVNIAFVMVRTNNYGGVCQGPRWFFWLIPVWLFCLPAAVEKLKGFWAWRWLLGLALAVSFFSVDYALFQSPGGPWDSSWLHEWMKSKGLA